MSITLYHYWRSTASWRARWALEIKGIKYKSVHVNLLDGENERKPHITRNPMGYVPALEVDGRLLVESLAIIEWLEETKSTPPLLPQDPWDRAHVRALAEFINAGIQPICNLSTLEKYSDDDGKRKEWSRYFIKRGFTAYEKLAGPQAGKFSFGDQITMADVCLIPQVYGALRNEVDMREFPLVEKIYQNALLTSSCQTAHPDRFKPA